MRGEIGIRDDGNFRPLVAHNTTHIDMPLHFLEHTPDLEAVLNNPAYRINLPMRARVLDLSTWPDAQCFYTQNGVRYCERVALEMLPAVADLQQYDALVLLTGFGAVMRQGSEPFSSPTPPGFITCPTSRWKWRSASLRLASPSWLSTAPRWSARRRAIRCA